MSHDKRHAEPAYVTRGRVFGSSQCARLIEAFEAQRSTFGGIGSRDGASTHDFAVRRVQSVPVCPWHDELWSKVGWASEKLQRVIAGVNERHFGYDLVGLDGMVLLKYEADADGGNGHYGWHRDTGRGGATVRKLTASVQLSERNEYEGCELEIFVDGPQAVRGLEPAGSAVVFPAWASHRVTPIRSGRRYALVAWACGPRFR